MTQRSIADGYGSSLRAAFVQREEPIRTKPQMTVHFSKGMTLIGVLFLGALIALIPSGIQAQVLYGTLVGNVTDASGYAIVGATITATNNATGIAKTTTSDAAGIYRVSDLEAGTYTVTATAKTFNKVQSNAIEVHSNTVERFDTQLSPASVGQTVTVTAAPPELQTDSATVTSELETTELQNLDGTQGANMRNFQSLYILLPGFTPPGSDHSESGNPSDTLVTNINGVSESNNNMRIDGVSDVYPWLPEIAAYAPSIEAVATVNAVTNAFDAEQGLAAGTVINLTSKSGGNTFHGNAWEYNIISALQARNFFLPTTSTKPKYTMNQFGANYGGPIKKNKAFFFGNWERTRRALAETTFQTIPFTPMLTGDFSSYSTVIYDPLTGNPDGTGRTPFLNNKIPAGRIAFASNIMAGLMPAPNVNTSTLSNNYFAAASGEYTRDNVDTKIDWNPSSKSTVFGRYGFQKTNLFDPQTLGKAGGAAVDGGQPGTAPSLIQSIGIGGTYTFKPNLLLDANVGFLRQGMGAKNVDLGTNYGLTVLNIPGTNGTNPLDGGYPAFKFSTSISSLGNPNNSNPFHFWDEEYTTAANLSWNLNKHSTRYGMEFQHSAINHFQPQNTVGPRGGFTFSGGLTALNGGTAANGYNAWADFLLGMPYQVQKDTQYLSPATIRENIWAFYARDQWQIDQKLTLTYGIRYEYYPIAKRDHTGLDILNPVDGYMYVGGVNGLPESAGVSVGRGDFGPRIGLAYRFDNKTVVRAGYGLSINPDSYRNVLTSYPAVLSQNYTGNTTYLSPYTLAQGIPALTPPSLSSGSLFFGKSGQTGGTLSTTTLPLNYRRGYYESYNLAVERELPGAVTLNATYVGTLIIREVPGININAAPPNGGTPGEPLNVLFGLSASVTSEIPDGTGHYNGLQAQAKRRFSNNGNVGITYTYSRSINDYGDNSDGSSSLLVNSIPYFHLNKGVAGFDRTHNFQGFGSYTLPFGKGQSLLQSGVGNYILGGWGLSGSVSRMSGIPINVTGSASSLNAPGNTQWADQLVKKVTILGGHNSTHPYFDTTAFADPSVAEKAANPSSPIPRFGTAGRNSIRGPGFFNMALTASRVFPINERYSLQFRCEAFNVTNTPSFSNPAANVSASGFGIISSTSNPNRELRLSGRVNF
jgi:hypothetical protein